MVVRRVRVVAAILVGVLGGSACSKQSGALGAGEDVNVCAGYAVYDSLDEPSPSKPKDVRVYADALLRVLDRIQTDLDIPTARNQTMEVPESVDEDLALLRTSAESFRDGVRAAGDDAGRVRSAMNQFTADEAYRSADARLGDFVTRDCRR